jgi:hypothetical protein
MAPKRKADAGCAAIIIEMVSDPDKPGITNYKHHLILKLG